MTSACRGQGSLMRSLLYQIYSHSTRADTVKPRLIDDEATAWGRGSHVSSLLSLINSDLSRADIETTGVGMTGEVDNFH